MAAIGGDRPRFVWLMGLLNMTYGYAYAVVLVTVPQQLAVRGAGEPAIAALTALALAVALGAFALAPVLDTLISRRAWSIVLAVLAAGVTVLVLVQPPNSALLGPILAIDTLAMALFNAAVGGWLGAALPKDCDDSIGTWFMVGNSVGFSLGALSQFWLLSNLPAPFGALAVGAIVLVPLVLVPVVPAHDVGRRAVRESFGALARDVGRLVRRGEVVRVLVLFLLPCAAFTLTNAFGGMGGDFHASAMVVDSANGVGAMIAGFLAALAVRQILGRVPAPVVYLAVGCVGAAFTCALLGLPRTPAIYVLAVVGECFAQGMAQVAQNAIMFRSIPPDSPLASSQFGLLQTAAVVPYAYMQALDGYGYKLAGGVAGSFLMDAGISLAACAALVLPVMRWLRAGKLDATEPAV